MLIAMIAHAIWSRDLPEVNGDYHVESNDVRRHGNVKGTSKEGFSRAINTGKLFTNCQH